MDILKRFASGLEDSYDDDTSTPEGHVPPPTPAEVLYANANPGGDGKRCGNCFLYSRADSRCVILDPAMEVSPDAVCNYHLYTAAPKHSWPMERVTVLTTDEVGFVWAGPAGTSCDRCAYYVPTPQVEVGRGECLATREPGGMGLPRVAAKGCCARWTEAVAGEEG